jgi:hypothetical protein
MNSIATVLRCTPLASALASSQHEEVVAEPGRREATTGVALPHRAVD